MWKILVVLLCLAALILLVVMICDSNRFVKVSYRISDRRLKKNCRVVLLSDLHNKSYCKHNEKLLASIKSSNPDLILCAGDLITSRSGKSMEHAKELVRAISAEYPLYYANGNHEYRIYREPQTYGKMGASYRAFLKGNHVRILENGSVLLPEYGIRITGLDLPREYYQKLDRAKLEPKAISRMVGHADQNDFQVLLAHNPVFFDAYAGWGADLTLSGHIHGGIVRIPGIGGVISTSYRLFPKYDGGYYEQNQKKMIVSRGLGSHTIPVRLFNPAELVVIDLVAEE